MFGRYSRLLIYHERGVHGAADDVPEHLIAADPAFWLDSQMGASIEPDVMADYIHCFSDPGTIAGSCADYGAAASTDLTDDDESFAAGQKIGRPALALWGSQGFVGRAYEPLGVWQEYAADVRGAALPLSAVSPNARQR
jgi:haloacetate dehalogenase